MGVPSGGGKAAGNKKVAGRKGAVKKAVSRKAKTYGVSYKGKTVRVSVPK